MMTDKRGHRIWFTKPWVIKAESVNHYKCIECGSPMHIHDSMRHHDWANGCVFDVDHLKVFGALFVWDTEEADCFKCGYHACECFEWDTEGILLVWVTEEVGREMNCQPNHERE
jgi:hypothetical protein